MTTKRNLGTVARATSIMRCVVEAPQDVSIKSIADELSLAPSTVHRLMNLLVEQGFVEISEGGRSYRTSTDFYRLAAITVEKGKISKIARPFMKEAVGRVNEFCLLCVYISPEREMFVAETMSSSHLLGFGAEKFVRQSVAWGAHGRSITAFLDPAEIRAIFDTAIEAPGDGSAPPSWKEFTAELAQIRSRGYARTGSQIMPGVAGIGAPIFGASGAVLGSLALVGPEARFTPDREAELAATVRKQASGISHAMGHRA